MGKFILKRLGISLLILLIVTFVIYGLMRLLPASYVETMAQQLSQAPGAKPYEQWVEELNAQYGLNTGVVQGYFIQLGNMLTGNFGDSWKYAVPVTQKFFEVIGVSVVMGAIALVFELVIAIGLGILAARKQYTAVDYTISVGALLGISLPAFFFATLLKLIFSVELGWFDLFGLVGRDHAQLTAWGKFWDMAQHLVLPITTIVAISIGSLMRYTRTNMLEVLNADYIRTARAKGVGEGDVVFFHAFRNTLIPLVTVVGGSLPGLFAGALITETLFAIPGIGYTAYQAMVAGDIPFSMFYLTFLAALTLLGNLLSDILYAVVDPRVRLGG
ncbi:MAG: ABC transporter permease [Oscillospiraceae bacterium]|nr:ABC transporter permease [Oscillospiraceae bacterium]